MSTNPSLLIDQSYRVSVYYCHPLPHVCVSFIPPYHVCVSPLYRGTQRLVFVQPLVHHQVTVPHKAGVHPITV